MKTTEIRDIRSKHDYYLIQKIIDNQWKEKINKNLDFAFLSYLDIGAIKREYKLYFSNNKFSQSIKGI